MYLVDTTQETYLSLTNKHKFRHPGFRAQQGPAL